MKSTCCLGTRRQPNPQATRWPSSQSRTNHGKQTPASPSQGIYARTPRERTTPRALAQFALLAMLGAGPSRSNSRFRVSRFEVSGKQGVAFPRARFYWGDRVTSPACWPAGSPSNIAAAGCRYCCCAVLHSRPPEQLNAGYDVLARATPPEFGGTHSSAGWHSCSESFDEDKHQQTGDASPTSPDLSFNINNSSTSGGGGDTSTGRPTAIHW